MSDIEFETRALRMLRDCHPRSGYTNSDFTALFGRQPGRSSNRQHSASVNRMLLSMEKRGLIRRMDDAKPIVWQLARNKDKGQS